MNPFICTYTNKCKDYCDKQFFDNLKIISGENEPVVVDNTVGTDYTPKLLSMGVFVVPLWVDPSPERTFFLRSVANSANVLRDIFLASGEDHFLVIESDVTPPHDLLVRLSKRVEELGDDWGAIGALYYPGFHDYSLKGLQQTHHVLSGCTLYNRKLIESTPFRWSEENLDAFPDAFMSLDAKEKGYKLYNDHDIHCGHLYNLKNGSRVS